MKNDFDRGNEELKNQKDPGESLLRTMGTASIVSSCISILGTFYILFRGSFSLAYWLSFMIPYGVMVLLSMFVGFFAIFQKDASKYSLYTILGCIYGGLLCLSFIPNGIFLGNWSIAIAIGVIGGCVFAIALLTYLQLHEKAK